MIQLYPNDMPAALRFFTFAILFILSPGFAYANPVISEFMASNNSILADDDGDFSDWIEIHNPTGEATDLAGWHLTDRQDNPTMWTFPPVSIGPGEFLVVFASNKDRTDPAQPLHTSFALSAGGEYLGLIAPDGVTAATEFVPEYPGQSEDISYGLAADAPAWIFIPEPTPGSANLTTTGSVVYDVVIFSEPARTFTGTLPVTLSGATGNQIIRYTTDGSLPAHSSLSYTSTLQLSSTTYLRARIFNDEGVGGPTASQHYLRLASSVSSRRSNLPMVVLDTHAQELNDTTRSPAIFQLFDRDESGISDLSRTPDLSTRHGLRWRGSSSLNQPKKPYSVEFRDEHDESVRIPLLGMTEEADWVFYAPYNFDRSYIRNSVAYSFSRNIGRWAPETRFVEVFLNDDGGDLTDSDYVGVYAIIEQIKMNSRRLGYDTVEPSDTPPPGPIDVMQEGSWTGGYLFKIDRTEADEYDWHTTRNIPTRFWLTLNRPKISSLDGGPYANKIAAGNGSRQVAYLKTYVQAFEDALYDDQTNGFSTRNYPNFIDRDSFTDHLIICAFLKNVDAMRLSGYFHKPVNSPIIAGPVWDFDRSINSYDGRDNEFDTWVGTEDATAYFEHEWWGVLAADPDFRQAFYDRWAELRQSLFSDTAIRDLIEPMGLEIDNQANGLGSAAQRDASRWSANRPRSNSYMAEIEHIITWLTNRAQWMDQRRTNGALLPSTPTVSADIDPVSGATVVTLSDSSGTLYYTTDGTDPRGSGGTIEGLTYTAPFQPDETIQLVARQLDDSGNWSTPIRIEITATDVDETWNGYPVNSDGWADTGTWMNYLYVAESPWIYSESAGWFYEGGIDENGGWLYFHQLR